MAPFPLRKRCHGVLQTSNKPSRRIGLESLPEAYLEDGRAVIGIRVVVESNGEAPIGDAHPLTGTEGVILETDVEINIVAIAAICVVPRPSHRVDIERDFRSRGGC